MPRKTTFNAVPEPVLELANDKAEAALQATAAFAIQTLEDAERVVAGGQLDEVTPEGLLRWAESMREDIATHWKDDLLDALGKQGFLMNTHGGFLVGPLKGPPTGIVTVLLYREIEMLAGRIAEGELEMPEDEELVALLMSRELDHHGYKFWPPEDLVRTALQREGKSLLLNAVIKYLTRKI